MTWAVAPAANRAKEANVFIMAGRSKRGNSSEKTSPKKALSEQYKQTYRLSKYPIQFQLSFRVPLRASRVAIAGFPGKFTKARDDASGDPPNHDSNHAEPSFFSDGSGRRGDVDEVMKLDTVENGVSHADVREVHAEGLASVDTWPSLLICSPHGSTSGRTAGCLHMVDANTRVTCGFQNALPVDGRHVTYNQLEAMQIELAR